MATDGRSRKSAELTAASAPHDRADYPPGFTSCTPFALAQPAPGSVAPTTTETMSTDENVADAAHELALAAEAD